MTRLTEQRFFLDERGALWDNQNLSEAVMSDTPYERYTNRWIIENSRGRVLIFGLGIGMILPEILNSPFVTEVVVVEKYQEVIDLIKYPPHSKLKIIQGDVFTIDLSGVGNDEFDVIWMDIWTSANEDKEYRLQGVYSGDSHKCFVERWLPKLKEGGQINYWKPTDHFMNDWGIYHKSDIESLKPVFEKYVTGMYFVDLGAGRGDVVKLASEYTDFATGMEADPTMTTQPRNFIDEDFNEYEVLYYYLMGSKKEQELKEKLKTFKGLVLIHFNTIGVSQVEEFCEGFNIVEKFDKTYVISN